MKTEEIVIAIIREQSQIIGDSLAQDMAVSTGVVKINSLKRNDITLTTQDYNTVIDKLINAYKSLFGQASVEVCHNVIRKYSNK